MDLIALVRALHLGAVAVLIGGLAFPLLVLPLRRVPQPQHAALSDWLARLRLYATWVALATWLAWLAPVAMAMSGLGMAQALRPGVLELVLAQTRFGHVWLVRCALLLLLAGWLAWTRPRAARASGRDAIGLALAAALLVSQVFAGHATAAPASHVVADALHLAAAAVWIGCLPPLLFVLARARAGAAPWDALALAAARGFTGMGVLAVAVLAVSGFLNGRMMVGSLQALVDTGYGRLILAKIVLFAVLLALAANNRLRLTPLLASDPAHRLVAARRLWRTVAAELVLGAAIFGIVGVLAGSEPPAHRDDGPGAMQDHMGARMPE
ncbi:CopD family protein [Ramlibacter ginsenosidimutans]|uniref:CopD family protein n=1 Tax=Ramlibacter ginsenosidimutans TaxID=502333 RepID=A0A934TTY9_9BURK|nr:CopD family protein [Ramlibacter ginsenosidimutans]MBK6007343.1 CopD family protein [Ramlibacter ginsenosidimutans]